MGGLLLNIDDFDVLICLIGNLVVDDKGKGKVEELLVEFLKVELVFDRILFNQLYLELVVDFKIIMCI